MANKIKILDQLTAGAIFLLVVNELISHIRCVTEDYNGEVKGSDYLINGFAQHTSIQGLLIGFFLMFLIHKFSACIYTKIVVYLYFSLQIFNSIALFFELENKLYDKMANPMFLFSIFGIIILKSIRWSLQKHS